MWFHVQMESLWFYYSDHTKGAITVLVKVFLWVVWLLISPLLKAGDSPGEGGQRCWPGCHPEPRGSGMASSSSERVDPPATEQPPATKSNALPASFACRSAKHAPWEKCFRKTSSFCAEDRVPLYLYFGLKQNLAVSIYFWPPGRLVILKSVL